MELFRSNKREKPDIEFITKAKLKKLEIVPPKNNGDTMTGNLFMPHLSEESRIRHRWLLRIPNELGMENHWVTFARPTQRQSRLEIPYMSTSTWTTGRHTWDDLYLEFRDFEGGSVIIEWYQTAMEGITGRQGYGGGVKKDMEVEMLDPTGVIVEKWVLSGCMPKEVRYHQEMDETNPTLGVNFSIDRAVLIT
jgi:hypothetical protein